MLKFFISLGIALFSSLLAFWLVSLMVDGFSVTWGGIFLAAAIFTVVQALLAPVVYKLAEKYAGAILGGVGLVSTFLALLITNLINGGIDVKGTSAWIASTVLIWLIAAIATWLLSYFLINKWLKERNENKAVEKRMKKAQSK